MWFSSIHVFQGFQMYVEPQCLLVIYWLLCATYNVVLRRCGLGCKGLNRGR